MDVQNVMVAMSFINHKCFIEILNCNKYNESGCTECDGGFFPLR